MDIHNSQRVEAAGTPPKTIEEFHGRVATGDTEMSIALMRSPAGWKEPGQTPEFTERTSVLMGKLVVRTRDSAFTVEAGQSVTTPPGVWVRYETPVPTEYVAVCTPAFSPDLVHRDPE